MGTDLLVTTSFSFLIVSLESGVSRVIHHGQGLYYGITRSDPYIYVAARKRLVSSAIPFAHERGEILVFNRNLTQVHTIVAPFPLRDMHQILWHDNKLWITCCYDNMVAIYDGQGWQRWFPLGEPQSESKDVNHFNTLSVFGDELCVVAHNNGPSELLFFSLPSLGLLRSIALGNQAHNVWKYRSEWLSCSSGEGMIKGSEEFELITGGFPRGVAFTEKEIVIGVSEIAERKDRDFTTSEILIFDYLWRPKRKIRLLQQGLLLDIQVFDRKASSPEDSHLNLWTTGSFAPDAMVFPVEYFST